MRKRIRQKLRSSIVTRILFVVIILIIIPLFLHSFFLYQKGYRTRVKELFQVLKVIGRNKVGFIDELIQKQQDFLHVIKLYDWEEMDAKDGNQLLSSLSEAYKENELFYVSIKDGTYTCKLSSIPSLRGQDCGFIKQYVRPNEFSFIKHDPVNREPLLYVGVKTTNGILVAAFEARRLIQRLSEQPYYPIHASLVYPDGRIFVTTNKHLSKNIFRNDDVYLGKKIESFTMQAQEELYAVSVPVTEVELFLILDVQESRIASVQKKEVFFHIGLFIFFIGIVGGGAAYYFSRRIGRPLSRLLDVIMKVGKGNLEARYQEDKLGFEINTLGEGFNTMMDSLIEHQDQIQQEKIHKELYLKELQIASEIQNNLIPKKFPDILRVNIGADFHPAMEVSGDFYDFVLREDGKLFFYIADISGKGVEGCLFSLTLRSLFRSQAEESNLAEIVYQANELFRYDTEEKSMFATSWIGMLDTKDYILSYTSMGHPPALLCSSERIQRLTTPGIALGVKDQKIVCDEIQLKKGDLLFLYTDGVIEEQNEEGEFFTLDRLEKFLQKKCSDDPQAVVASVFHEVETFRKEKGDDLAALSIKIS